MKILANRDDLDQEFMHKLYIACFNENPDLIHVDDSFLMSSKELRSYIAEDGRDNSSDSADN